MNWASIAPISDTHGCTTVMSEAQILNLYKGKTPNTDPKTIIDDYVIVYWAWPTNIPPGEYP